MRLPPRSALGAVVSAMALAWPAGAEGETAAEALFIDVSHHSGQIGWKAVVDQGFALVHLNRGPLAPVVRARRGTLPRSMIAVSGLAKAYGQQTLFTGVAFQLNPGSRYGLVGANGSGKSTLLRILAGEEMPSEGVVSIPKRLRLGVLRQDHFRYEDMPILQVVLMGNPELFEAIAEKEALLERADQEFDAERYAALEDVVLHHDGYAMEARAAEVLEGLGIPAEVHHQPLSTLSGGFKLRVLLAQTLAAKPDALLLDEPTNHLDILSIRWLEKFLQEFAGLAVVISHDHRFLDNVSTNILDVDYETVTLYPGNYSRFIASKVAERDRREAGIARREKEIAHHQAFVDRFRAKATKARQAQSKLRLIEKMAAGLEPLAPTSRRYPRFAFKQRRPSGRLVVEAKGITKAYGDKPVLRDVELAVRRGDRIAIIGPNGIGKSTLLKILVGALPADAGALEWGHETYPGYFAQDHREQLGDEKLTIESWFWHSCPGEPIGFVRGQLAKVLFSKDEAQKRLGALSGGEAARLIFARLAVDQPNVMILDEPTNHLDLEAIEALVEALADYDGTLLFVSHDRWFVSQLASRIVEITRAGIRDFAGTYEEYLEACGDDHLDAEAVALKARQDKRRERENGAAAADPDRERERQRRRKQLTARGEELASAIEIAEGRIHAINELFCDPSYFDRTPRQEVAKREREQKELTARVEELMREWSGVEEELAQLAG